jgi:hypothetical protein
VLGNLVVKPLRYLTPFPLKEYPFFLGTTEDTPEHRGKEEIGNLGAGRE